MFKRFVLGGVAALALGAVLFAATPASAVATPVGNVSASQVAGPCGDLGANVSVTVTGGFANTAYTATGTGPASSPAHWTTNGSGAGGGTVLNVLPAGGWTGNATITVTAAGHATPGQVQVAIACADPRGGKELKKNLVAAGMSLGKSAYALTA